MWDNSSISGVNKGKSRGFVIVSRNYQILVAADSHVRILSGNAEWIAQSFDYGILREDLKGELMF